MLKAAVKILKEEFNLFAKAPSPEKRLYKALKGVEAMRKPLKDIAPVREQEDLRLACANGEVATWSFDQYVDIRLTQKGWFANDVTNMFHQFRGAAKQGRIALETFAEKVKDNKAAQFVFTRTGDLETLAKELGAMKPADMKDVPVVKFWA